MIFIKKLQTFLILFLLNFKIHQKYIILPFLNHINVIYLQHERRNNIEIKIIGSSFSEGKRIKKEIKSIARREKIDISVLEINDKNNIRKYKVLQTPTLVINDEYKYDEKINYNILKRLIMFCSQI